ncbi:RGG repeats nuclear RNA binding protein A-like [Curcuma longa]|uniref:RGG repeats nuclear RNA binding protein A-like n=1 Tax=Curcuma longa TaxID=136217 RepID=UPI003D9E90C9
MATLNPFDILGEDDNDDPSQLIAVQQQKLAAKKPAVPASVSPVVAKLPTKPLPPSQAVRESKEARNNVAPTRGGNGRGIPGRGRGGGRGPNRDFGNENSNGYNRPYGGGRGGGGGGEDGEVDKPERVRPPHQPFSGGRRGGYGGGGGEDGEVDKPERVRPPHQPFSGGRRGGYGGRGGYGNGESGGDSERPPRRLFERRSGTGRGEEMKRQGGGRGNWGTATDETLAQEKDDVIKSDENLPTEGHAEQENAPLTEESKDKEGTTNETEDKEEDKEMTLEEYEKVKEEKRKALLALKAEERKVEVDKDLQAMQLLATKKEIDPIFVKLGSDKDIGKRKDNADRDEKSRKPLNINEFFKTGDGKQYYSSGGRGRGRGRGNRAPFESGFGGRGTNYITEAPSIEDPGQFPTLGGK